MTDEKILGEAKQFVISSVVEPALNFKGLSEKSKGKIRRTKLWVNGCRKVGDIYDYISRYRGQTDEYFRGVYSELKGLSLTAVEDIIEPFSKMYAAYLNDRFLIDDLRVGEIYTSWDISIISKTYNEQQGIYLVRHGMQMKAILTKVTLETGRYQNEWLNPDTLKHYMKSRLDKYDENYEVNRAVIESGDAPIYVFVKSGKACVYNGVFSYHTKGSDESGAKWFVLKRREAVKNQEFLSDHEDAFERKIVESFEITKQERERRIKEYPEMPKRKSVTAFVFERNPYVVHAVLERARGVCELCKKPAPFVRKRGGIKNTPYLEVHHKQRLADNGKDTIENAIALCPNCHRREHFG